VELQILHRDDVLLAVFKPAWTVVHRGLALDGPFLSDAVRETLGVRQVHPIHRLDRQASGPVLFALSSRIAAVMQSQFFSGAIHKSYLALVRGVPPRIGVVDSPVPAKEGGERIPARTEYTLLETARTQPRDVSLIRAVPVTGRFHQIRRHFKHINHPLIGDANYGKGDLNRAFKERYGLCRMGLHAEAFSFDHPVSLQRMTVRAALPDDFLRPLQAMGFQVSNFENE